MASLILLGGLVVRAGEGFGHERHPEASIYVEDFEIRNEVFLQSMAFDKGQTVQDHENHQRQRQPKYMNMHITIEIVATTIRTTAARQQHKNNSSKG